MTRSVLQCPKCSAIWNPETADLYYRYKELKRKYAMLLRQRDKMTQEAPDLSTYEKKFKTAQLKVDMLIVEHAAKGLREELKGTPSQMWQVRYEKALEVARSMMANDTYQSFKRKLDEACRPSNLK